MINSQAGVGQRSSWTSRTTHPAFLISNDDAVGIDAVAATLAEKYATTETLALIAEKFGKEKVSEFLRKKFPEKASARSGRYGRNPRNLIP